MKTIVKPYIEYLEQKVEIQQHYDILVEQIHNQSNQSQLNNMTNIKWLLKLPRIGMRISRQIECYFIRQSNWKLSVIHSIIEYVFIDVKEIITFLNRFISFNIDKIFVMEIERATAFYNIYCETC